MKLKEVLDKTTNFFKEKKIDSPRLDAELLLAHGLGLERIQLYLKFDQPLKEEELQVCRELVRRRMTGEPVAYIIGYKYFYGFPFSVNANVLIPRPETEHLVEVALNWAKVHPNFQNHFNILDLGAGTGCVGLTLLKKLPQAKLISIDISEKALEVAKQNAENLEVLDRTSLLFGDAEKLADEVKREIDIIVGNPPYIGHEDLHVEADVKKFEPEIALFAKDKGLHFLKAWSDKYKNHLNTNGIMLMEMGFDQGSEMKKHFETLQHEGTKVFQEVRIIKDLSGHDRIICGVKNG